jgi:hypothetical protein
MTYLKLILIWSSAGIGFNISQRALDYLLDGAFKHVTWLAWLAN